MNAFANWLWDDTHFALVVAGLGLAALALLRWSVRYLRSCRGMPVVLSTRGELADAPEVESIPEDPTAQTCVLGRSGLDEPTAACLRRNYVSMSEDDRYELNLTFASIVTPEEVEP